MIGENALNSNLCSRFKKALHSTCASLTPAEKEKPTSLLKAFYDNLHLVSLFPLFENDFDIEIGGDNWKKLIGNYKTFGNTQKVTIPPFEMLSTLFDPEHIVNGNKD